MSQLNVLFLALSGVRIKDRELRDMGMTLPGFIDRGKTIAELPSLGLLTLAGCTPDSWEVSYRELDELDDAAVTGLVNAEPSLVAISALTARILDAYRIADALRARGVTVVLGGLHVSALPDEAARHADCIVTGQAELVWPQLLDDFESGQLQKRYEVPRTGGSPLQRAAAPIPRYDLLDLNDYNRIALQTTRGCPLDCSFCGASRMIATYQRKPIEQVRRELDVITGLWERPFVELADDNTFVDKAWSRDLVRLLGEYPLRWFTETDLSIADDEALLDALADSGCAQLLIGLESAQRDSLRGVDSRDWKWQQAEDYAQKIERIQSRGISVNGCFVLGFDSDDESVFADTLDMVQALNLAEVQITLLTAFPGTPLYRQLRAEGRLLKEVFWDECTLFDVTFQPKQMSAEALRRGFRHLMGELYSVERVAERQSGHRSRLRQFKRQR